MASDAKSLDSKNDDNITSETVNENKTGGGPETSGARNTSSSNKSNDFDDVSSLRKFLDEDTAPECSLKNNNQLYCSDRETAKTLMYLIDSRDRHKVSAWIEKLDQMKDKEGLLERVIYIRYLVATLSGSLGLVEPFTSMPPDKVKSLQLILPGTVYADLVKDQPEICLRRKVYAHKMPSSNSSLLQDKRFYEQQLFPPEGIICYAAAFSVI